MGRTAWVVVAGGVLLLLSSRTLALSCYCTDAKCPNLDDCGTRGDEMGPCKCCRVCKKAEDEMCGGPFGVSGSCGNGLECVKEEYIDYDQAFGVCKRWLKSSVGSPGSSVYLDKPHHHRLTRTPTD